jgi:putative methionine-R-sulfoxide reductase with GAF domain
VVGESYVSGKEMYVPDVSVLKNYIACDAKSKSEYVVPVIKDGEIKAVFDIDSEYIDGLKDDVPLLREIGRLLGELLSDF